MTHYTGGTQLDALHFLSSYPTGNYWTYAVVALSLEASCWERLLLARQRKVGNKTESLTTIYDGNQLLSW